MEQTFGNEKGAIKSGAEFDKEKAVQDGVALAEVLELDVDAAKKAANLATAMLPKPEIILTPAQIAKIDAVRKVIGHIEPVSDKLFVGDGNPDREILVWEAIAAAYIGEAKTRSKLRKFDFKEQKLLLQVLLLTSIHGYDPQTLHTQFPEVRQLKNFQSAVIRFMKSVIDKAGPMPDLESVLATEQPPEIS